MMNRSQPGKVEIVYSHPLAVLAEIRRHWKAKQEEKEHADTLTGAKYAVEKAKAVAETALNVTERAIGLWMVTALCMTYTDRLIPEISRADVRSFMATVPEELTTDYKLIPAILKALGCTADSFKRQ